MHIRLAEVTDAGAVATVHVRSAHAVDGAVLDVEQRRAAWERIIADNRWPASAVLVAEVDAAVVGFANLWPAPDAGVGEVATIYTLPEVWGTGVGRALMDAVLTAAAAARYREVTLWVRAANTRARRFYEAGGWRPDGAVDRDRIRYRRGSQPR